MHARPAPASAANCSLCYSVAGKRHTTLLQAGEVQPSLQLGFPYTGKIAGGGADLWGGAACSGTQAPHISITCSGSGYMQEQVPHCPPSAADPSLLLLLACIFIPSTRDEIAGLTAQVAVPMHVNSI